MRDGKKRWLRKETELDGIANTYAYNTDAGSSEEGGSEAIDDEEDATPPSSSCSQPSRIDRSVSAAVG